MVTKILVEIQASHVGIGKSYFTKLLNYPSIDDCIDLIESFPEFFDQSKSLQAYLVLENSASTLDVKVEICPKDIVFTSSRSPLISCIQFTNFQLDWKALEEYYRRRLMHKGIQRVLILDYGTSIHNNPVAIRKGYDQMKKRGRIFELEKYISFEEYQKFFEEAEMKKKDIVQCMKNSDFYCYKEMSYHDFEEQDTSEALCVIEKFILDVIN